VAVVLFIGKGSSGLPGRLAGNRFRMSEHGTINAAHVIFHE
jgi:hypothetical protein